MTSSNSTSNSISNSALSVAPAPWPGLECEAFWFVTTTSASSLPAASYSPLESASPYASSGAFRGGLATIMIVRYTVSPVGPYDEIMWAPGAFDVAALGTKKLRITRIYVSSAGSTINGRRNWNIPKTVASFNFVPSASGGNGYDRITVSDLGAEAPFFAVDLKPVWGLGGMKVPLDLKWSPLDMELVQPPLPRGEEEILVGTEEWVRFKPGMKGMAGIVWGAGGLDGGKWGDGVGFPDVRPWAAGIWWSGMKINFPVGGVVKGGNKGGKDD